MIAMRKMLAALGLAALLAACGRDVHGPDDSLAKEGGIETVAIAGRLVLPGGGPAADVTIRLREAGYLKDTSERLTKRSAAAMAASAKRDGRTDSAGNYRFDSLPPADYRLEVRGDAGLGMIKEVQAAGESAELNLGPDTLRPTATLSGRIVPPRSLTDSVSGGWSGLVYVQVYGEERIEWAKALNGAFALNDLPPGVHRLRFSAGLDLIDARELTVTVLPGGTVDLGDIALYSFATEDYSLWPHSLTLAMDSTAVGAGLSGESGLPLLVRLDSSRFDFRNGRRSEIRFADRAGNHLHYRIERWDSAAGHADIWVKTRTLARDKGEEYLTLFWGEPGTPDLSDGHMVFDSTSGFVGVWNLDEDAAGTGIRRLYRDETELGGHGDDFVVTPSGEGIAGGACILSGSDYVSVRTPDPRLARPVRFTASAWIKAGRVMAGGSYVFSSAQGFAVSVTDRGEVRAEVHSGDAGGMVLSPPQAILDDSWHQVAAVYTGTELRLFVDGHPVASQAFTGLPARKYAVPFYLGGLGARYGWIGSLDEVEISGVARSAEWIRIAYENQKPGSTWFKFR